MIIDAHAHAFPHLNGPASDHGASTLLYLQKFVSDSPSQAVRRTRDNVVVADRNEWALWDESTTGLTGALAVEFRIGRYGRLEWTKGAESYYINLYSPSLQDMTATPEYILAEMDYAGVSMAVLQNAWLYGRLNDYFAAAQRRYPDRFIGTVQVNECRAAEDSQLAELRRGVQDLDLRALYYGTPRFFEVAYEDHIDDRKFDVFWDAVQELDIPVFWDISGSPEPQLRKASPFERYLAQMSRFERWLERHPDVPCILVHGVPLGHMRQEDRLRPIPEELWRIWERPNVHLELLFPMQVSHPVAGGTVWRYPYRELLPLIVELYERLGAAKLIWGSDLPNLQRNCTYRQGRDYLECHELPVPEHEQDLLFGGNVARLLHVRSEATLSRAGGR
jgi:predicted TIM-barrel fold metal-dependent hydrolase